MYYQNECQMVHLTYTSHSESMLNIVKSEGERWMIS